MPLEGFEPTIPASERAKAVHVLDSSATVTGTYEAYCRNIAALLGRRVVETPEEHLGFMSALQFTGSSDLRLDDMCIGWESVHRLATGWTAEWSEFESRYGDEFSTLNVVQTGCGAHPASYPLGNVS
jgi:hypothetical protein